MGRGLNGGNVLHRGITKFSSRKGFPACIKVLTFVQNTKSFSFLRSSSAENCEIV